MIALQAVGGDLAVNTWLVAIVALLHIEIAAFLTGSTTLAAVGEAIAMASGDERHERLAHGQVRAWAYVFSFGSALAIFWLIFVLTGVWGRFYVGISQITFVVFVFEAGTFIAEVILLYTLYANWERLRRVRRARLGLLILLNLSQWWQMFFINVVASYMLTPNGGDTSVLRQILNPTDLPLTLHRTVGNIAWAGGIIAAVAGFRYLRATRREGRTTPATGTAPLRSVGAMAHQEGGPGAGPGEEAAFWDWAGQWGLLWAFGLTLLQPWIGYSYAKEVQLHSYDSWYTMMFGGLSNTFLFQLGLLGLIFILGSLYFARRLRAGGLRLWRRHMVVALLLIAVTLFAVQPAWFASSYPDVVAAHRDQPWWQGGLRNPLGDFIPYKVLCLFLMVIMGIYALTSFLRARQRGLVTMGEARRGSQGLLLGLGATVMVMMAVMGVIRETSREPFLIHGELTIQHQDNLHPGPAGVQEQPAGPLLGQPALEPGPTPAGPAPAAQPAAPPESAVSPGPVPTTAP